MFWFHKISSLTIKFFEQTVIMSLKQNKNQKSLKKKIFQILVIFFLLFHFYCFVMFIIYNKLITNITSPIFLLKLYHSFYACHLSNTNQKMFCITNFKNLIKFERYQFFYLEYLKETKINGPIWKRLLYLCSYFLVGIGLLMSFKTSNCLFHHCVTSWVIFSFGFISVLISVFNSASLSTGNIPATVNSLLRGQHDKASNFPTKLPLH